MQLVAFGALQPRTFVVAGDSGGGGRCAAVAEHVYGSVSGRMRMRLVDV